MPVTMKKTRETTRDDQLTVRPACIGDVARIAALSHQLGYPASSEEVQRRLNQVEAQERHAVYVAQLSDGNVVGWVHVYVCYLLEADPYAEIGGLVVDEACHGRGIGRLLLQRVEEWARGQGCRTVRVRSNVVREGAHAFYKRLDYRIVKTQAVFHKVL